MSIKIALLSGKGGSGKTTIALGIAELLSKCSIRVLLIDCDTATNGATYFFEKQLHTANMMLNSLENDTESFEKILAVSENMYFIPAGSAPGGSGQYTGDGRLKEFVQSLEKDTVFEIDVVLFDCQAGYSSVMREAVKLSDIGLIVMEPDSISASSVRVLYSQIYDVLEAKRTYQIFSKITEDEYEVYKKAVLGMFTSLPPMQFNWEVRKAFSYNLIPDFDSANSKFGYDIYNICKILFPSLDFSSYERRIRGKVTLELSREKEKLAVERKAQLRKMIAEAVVLLIYGLVGCTFAGILYQYRDILDNQLLNFLSVLCILLVLSAYIFGSSFRDVRINYTKKEKFLHDLEKKIKQLNDKIEENSQ